MLQSIISTNNVDDLARDKVQEVESFLDGHDDLKLDSIKSYFSILKQIITAADLHRTNNQTTTENSESIYADYADDQEQFNAVDLTEQFATNSVKWTIRVRAFKSVHRIFDLLLVSKRSSIILKILPDLIRLSFVAATSPYDDLKIQGFQMFRELINRFASVEEKEFPGHSILEQYKTQVLSALKPAFNLDAPPYITAIASQVCSQWICRGLEKDGPGLKRAYQLFEPSIQKLQSQGSNPNSSLYQEIELEQERLDILGSWAQLFIEAHQSGKPSRLLIDLSEDRVDTLVAKWLEALKDYALLIMLSPKASVTHDNEQVYTKEVALKLFTPVWPKLALAVTIWICLLPAAPDNHQKYHHFLNGLFLNEFCKCLQLDHKIDSLPESAILAMRSINILSDKSFPDDSRVAREFYAALARILIQLNNLRSSHKSLLRSSLSHIFKLILGKFRDNDKVIQYSLSQLMDSIRGGHLSSITSQQLILTNLMVLAKSRPDLLANDEKLALEFTAIMDKVLTEESDLSTVICVIDGLQSLEKVVSYKLFAAKQSLLLNVLSVHSLQQTESRILFETVIKSVKVDLGLLGTHERRESLAGLIRTLLSNFDPFKDDKDFVDQITQVLRDLERTFKEEFASLRSSDLAKTIDLALEPVTNDEEDSKTAKKQNNVVKKPTNKIVLKSDFSNFYSKK